MGGSSWISVRGKPALAEHPVELGEGVGVAAGGRREQDQTQVRGGGRCARVIGNELQRNCPTAWHEGRMDLCQHLFAARGVEVRQEVRQQYKIIATQNPPAEVLALDCRRTWPPSIGITLGAYGDPRETSSTRRPRSAGDASVFLQAADLVLRESEGCKGRSGSSRG
jgi:hypothetical protein